MSQDGVTILVGTTKGAFMISGKSERKGWRSVLANLVALLRPRHAICRNQTGKIAFEPGRRQKLGRSARFARPSFCRQLEPRRRRIGIAYDLVRSSKCQKTLDRDFGGWRLCD